MKLWSKFVGVLADAVLVFLRKEANIFTAIMECLYMRFLGNVTQQVDNETWINHTCSVVDTQVKFINLCHYSENKAIMTCNFRKTAAIECHQQVCRNVFGCLKNSDSVTFEVQASHRESENYYCAQNKHGCLNATSEGILDQERGKCSSNGRTFLNSMCRFATMAALELTLFVVSSCCIVSCPTSETRSYLLA